jgi:hypothetical protein
MAFEKGHKKSVGNKGGRRPSAYEEQQNAIWHKQAWEENSRFIELSKKIDSGVYSVRDMFLFKALGGNERVLSIFANKLLPDLVSVDGSIEVKDISEEKKTWIRNLFGS